MKKLFYLFSSIRLFTRLLSILAIAVVVFAVAADAQAQTRTRTGGASGTGSDWSMTIQIADETTTIVDLGNGFFNANASTAPAQTVSCTYNGAPALCSYPETVSGPGLVCAGFAVGGCSAKSSRPGTRTSTMTCPTPGAGCRGDVTVTNLAGLPLATIQIGAGLELIDTKQECGAEFPNTAGLSKFLMGKITQTCDKGVPWDPTDPILGQIVRTDLREGDNAVNYTSTTSWLDETPVACNPNNGFPPNACTNDGGTWLTIPTILVPATNDAQCAAAAVNLSCGQLPDGSAGPAPIGSKFDGTQCQFRCHRCEEEGSLVNVGTAGLGKFVLTDLTGTPPWAAACEVTVSGN